MEEKINNFDNQPKKAFYFTLVGGIIYLALGLVLFLFIFLKLFNLGWISENPEDSGKYLALICIALYISLVSLWIIVGSFWMKRTRTLMRGVWTAWILSLFSLNIIAAIGGIIGAMRLVDDSNERTTTYTEPIKEEEIKVNAGLSLSGQDNIELRDKDYVDK